MTRDEVLLELAVARKGFDDRVEAIPRASLTITPAGQAHSPAAIVSHVAAYERLVIERLVAARHGASTSFQRDREGWEEFNATTWDDAAREDVDTLLERARDTFAALRHEVSQLSDDELTKPIGATASLDPAWLGGRSPWRMIAVDTFEHYPQHYVALETAAQTASDDGR